MCRSKHLAVVTCIRLQNTLPRNHNYQTPNKYSIPYLSWKNFIGEKSKNYIKISFKIYICIFFIYINISKNANFFVEYIICLRKRKKLSRKLQEISDMYSAILKLFYRAFFDDKQTEIECKPWMVVIYILYGLWWR